MGGCWCDGTSLKLIFAGCAERIHCARRSAPDPFLSSRAQLVATLPFLLACCFGRRKDHYDPQAYEESHFGGGASVGRSNTHRSGRSQRNSQYAPSTRGSVRY